MRESCRSGRIPVAAEEVSRIEGLRLALNLRCSPEPAPFKVRVTLIFRNHPMRKQNILFEGPDTAL